MDARKIVLLYRPRELKVANIHSNDIECLRSLCLQDYKLNDKLTVYKNRLTCIIDQSMFKFKGVFSNIFSKAAVAVLEEYPTPYHILKANRNKLVPLIQKKPYKSLKWPTIKYEFIVSDARDFAPLSTHNVSNITMLGVYILMIKTLEENLEKILKSIHLMISEDMAKDIPIMALALELPQNTLGIGLLPAAILLTGIGDFFAFKKPNKLVAYLGIDLSVM